jgi:putative membrane protein
MKPSLYAICFLSMLGSTAQAGSPAHSKMPISPAQFVREAALSDMFETKSSELAAIKADTPTRSFAAQMNADHQKTSSELLVIVKGRQADLPLPQRLDARRQAEFDQLSALDGATFTKQYQMEQLKAHREAITLFRSFSAVGSDPRLRQWATETLPKLEEHLRHAKALAKPL